MQIEIKLDEKCTEPRVIIVTKEMNEELANIVKRLSDQRPDVLSGFAGDRLEIIERDSIIRAYCVGQKVLIVTENGEYTVRLRLYELEERLAGGRFARISNSEIINLGKVKCFDLSIAGTICVSMKNTRHENAAGFRGVLTRRCTPPESRGWSLEQNGKRQ